MAVRRAVSAGALIAALLTAAQAQAQPKTAQARAEGTIIAGIAITTRQDFVLGIALLSLPTMTRSLSLAGSALQRVRDGIRPAGGAGPFNADFIVNGDASQSISIAIPATVDLIRLGGLQTVKWATQTDFGGADAQTLAPTPRGTEGILAFNIGGRVLLDRDAVAGDYRGTLTATAQYN